jgi:hypothetical protein
MSIRITLGPVQVNHLTVFEKQVHKVSKKELYSCQIFINKGDKPNLKKVKKAIKQAKREKWGKDAPEGIWTFLRDGDIKNGNFGVPGKYEAGQEPFGGHYFIGASNADTKPEVVGRDPNVKLGPDDIKDGDWFFVSIEVFGWDKPEDQVICRLGNLQFFKTGEPMGNKVNASQEFDKIDEDEFDDFDEEDEDDDDEFG